MKPVIVSISGPSGAGKSFLANKLKENEGFKEIVSVTTRAPREGEQHGVHYFYVSKEEFMKMDENNQLIEKTDVNGNFYGVPSSEPVRLAKEGHPIVVVAEPLGVEQIKEYCKKNDWISLEVFVNSPMDVLLERLENRKNEELSKISGQDPQYMEKIEKTIKSSESRLKHLKEEEIEKWVKPAYSENSIFKLVFDSFNKENEKEVVNKVVQTIKALKEEKVIDPLKEKKTSKMKIK